MVGAVNVGIGNLFRTSELLSTRNLPCPPSLHAPARKDGDVREGRLGHWTRRDTCFQMLLKHSQINTTPSWRVRVDNVEAQDGDEGESSHRFQLSLVSQQSPLASLRRYVSQSKR